MIKGRREFTNKYSLGKTKFKGINFVQSLFSPCTSLSTALGGGKLIFVITFPVRQQCPFFNAIFLTRAHFSAGYGLRQTALIAITE